jgi:hypothetical protein
MRKKIHPNQQKWLETPASTWVCIVQDFSVSNIPQVCGSFVSKVEAMKYYERQLLDGKAARVVRSDSFLYPKVFSR